MVARSLATKACATHRSTRHRQASIAHATCKNPLWASYLTRGMSPHGWPLREDSSVLAWPVPNGRHRKPPRRASQSRSAPATSLQAWPTTRSHRKANRKGGGPPPQERAALPWHVQRQRAMPVANDCEQEGDHPHLRAAALSTTAHFFTCRDLGCITEGRQLVAG